MELIIGLVAVIAPSACLGLIVGLIAKKKGRNFVMWWIYGTVVFIIALVHVLIIKPEENNSNQAIESISKEEEELLKYEKRHEKQPLMISQYPALYLYDNLQTAKTECIGILKTLGFTDIQANQLFEFEHNILKRYKRVQLTDPNFAEMWVFDLKQPLFFNCYPSTAEELIEEKFFTISELCKILDEAEWHFMNNHEEVSDDVFADIFRWRLRGNGIRFAVEYYTMISNELGLPMELIQKVHNREGLVLDQLKWSMIY